MAEESNFNPFELVAASTNERAAADQVLDYLRCCQIFGDRGFIGLKQQAEIK